MFRREARLTSLLLLLLPLQAYASFIESTIGTAIVNDATATYYNPASLVVVKNPQLVGQGTYAMFNTDFTGQATQNSTGFTQNGSSSSQTHYYLPTIFMAYPATSKVTLGLACVTNFFNRDIEGNSVLRYVQSNNNIQDVDMVAAVGIKLNEYFSVGGGVTFSRANFDMRPTIGFPSLNIPDSESHNQANGSSWGGDVGFLLKPSSSTLIGFNYRGAISYRLSGTSVYSGTSTVSSPNYHFNFWTPARAVISMSQFASVRLGFIGTVQYIQSDIMKVQHVHGIATLVGTTPTIVNTNIPNYLHNVWLFTLGTNYRMNPQWIIRVAGSYSQSPGNPHYQVSNGDSIILGASTGYEINKTFSVDGSYAHAFIKNQGINIQTPRNTVTGVNTAYRDGISLKLTLNA